MVCAESAALVYVERLGVESRDVKTGEEEEGALARERGRIGRKGWSVGAG